MFEERMFTNHFRYNCSNIVPPEQTFDQIMRKLLIRGEVKFWCQTNYTLQTSGLDVGVDGVTATYKVLASTRITPKGVVIDAVILDPSI